MICEPNFNLPQKIDLEELRQKSQKTQNTDHKHALKRALPTGSAKYKIFDIQKDYNVLPKAKFHEQFDNLNAMLSLSDNTYLHCRWHEFLNNVPEDYVRIRLFVDYQKEKEISVIRRKILNGQFYGVDNKLAPIPQLRDPRNIPKS